MTLDHRYSPGIPDEVATRLGMPAGSGRGLFECPTFTCSHCQRVVMVNPKRNRERAYCPKCDHNLCDTCGAVRAANGGACKTFKQVIDEMLEQAAKAA